MRGSADAGAVLRPYLQQTHERGGPVIRHVVRVVAYVMVLGFAATSLVVAQTGTVRGTVADSSGSPLPNASLTIEGTDLRATSGPGGEYEITKVPAGRRTLRARLIGYESATAVLEVAATGQTRQNFTLIRTAFLLAPLAVV